MRPNSSVVTGAKYSGWRVFARSPFGLLEIEAVFGGELLCFTEGLEGTGFSSAMDESESLWLDE